VILGEGLSLDNAVRSNPSFNLTILPSGHSSIAPHEALKSLRLGELMEEARLRYEYVVLDSPPLIPFPDCRLLEKWIDGFLVVVAAHRTPRKLLEEAINVVDPAKMVGLVLNNDDRPVFGYYSYYTSGSSSNNGREARPGQSRRTGKKASRSLWRRRSALMRFDNQNR
jgi:Mrp family chromosome partitioning ATPase